MPTLQILVNLIPLLAGSFVKFLFFIIKGFGSDYLLGTIDGIKNLYMIDRVNFKKISIFTFINIEFELVINTFKYALNYIERHK